MKALPSIAFGGFSGSAKGVTARQAGGRTVLSGRSRPTGQASGTQVVRRSSFSRVTRFWKSLSEEQRQGWERLAGVCSGRSVFGRKAQVSGYNLFVRLNTNLLLVGGQMRSVAPMGQNKVPAVRFAVIFVSSTEVCVDGIEEKDDRLRLVVKMTAAQRAGVSSAWSRTVVVAAGMETDWGRLDLTDAFAGVMGVGVDDGKRYFVELYWIDSITGFSGPVARVSGIAGRTPIYVGESGGARSLVRIWDLENSDRCYFRSFEYELSHGGSAIGTCRGEYGYRNTRTNAYVELDDETAGKFVWQTSFFLCRGNRGGDWSIGYLQVSIVLVSDKICLSAWPYFDLHASGALVFDTAAPVSC